MTDESNSSSSVYSLATFGRLWDEHRPKLLAMLQRRIDPALNARVDPEHILNDTFMVARRRWTDFQAGTMTAYAWFYRLALDQLIEEWRKATRGRRDVRREMPLPEGTSIQLGLGLIDPGTSPSDALARVESRERVQQVMGLLKEKYREILLMRHVEYLSHPEIATVLGITEAAAQQRYHRAVARLSDLWQKLYPDEGSKQ
jgi:RNA polymerase sigma-70 factor (ECF subfamily)